MHPSSKVQGLAFGRFLLLPHRRELLVDSEPVKLGGRAFDVLMALVNARGAVLSKEALMERTWPGQIVEESALQSQVSALRSALGAERNLIRTVSGRGYQFTGEIRAVPVDLGEHAGANDLESQDARTVPQLPGERRLTNLPAPVSELIGRDHVLAEIQNLLSEHRLVTLSGSGGIGKTRLAVAAARGMLSSFAHGVWLSDLSPLVDAALVAARVAGAVGLEISSGEISAERVAQVLADRRRLLVLDTCEHLIAGAAELVQAALRAGEGIHFLVTSREPLQVEGEWIYPVPPLDVPAEDVETDDQILRYGAVQLFVQRARAANPRLVLHRQALSGVAAICRRLDGIPLAIEMAAARTSTLRPDEIAVRLDDRFQLLVGRQRMALPRHHTLRATLDWSYELLTESERVVLRHLATFSGPFSLDAASVVAAQPPEIAPWQVIEGISMLVSKSLVAAEAREASMRFRLLDTTRAYALEKLEQTGDRERLFRRHAEFYLDLFNRAEAEYQTRPTAEWLFDYGPEIDHLRSALDWAFSATGDALLGIALTTAAFPLWLHLSLLDECRDRIEQALAAEVEPDARRAMKLNAGLGATLMYTRSVTDPEVRDAWTTALDIAARLGDVDYHLRALLGVWGSHMRSGGYRAALQLAEKFHSLAAESSDRNDRMIGERMIGEVHYLGGNLVCARRHIEHMLTGYSVTNRWPDIIRFQIDQFSRGRALLARILWLQGFPDQAMRTAKRCVEDAQASNHPISLCYALAQAACPIALLVGDDATADHYIAMLLDRSKGHALPLWEGWGRYYHGVLLINRGDVGGGVRLLRSGLSALGGARFAVRFVTFLGDVAEALGAAGEIATGLAEVDEAVGRFRQADENWLTTDMLRCKGELLLLQDESGAAVSSEKLFREALDQARRLGALSWELRAATSLARLKCGQGRTADALSVLQPVYDRLTEGFETVDVIAARRLFGGLSGVTSRG
jgi:predicted ATPase/DNA-binding winged helix-turn-helix (wHTH) protein